MKGLLCIALLFSFSFPLALPSPAQEAVQQVPDTVAEAHGALAAAACFTAQLVVENAVVADVSTQEKFINVLRDVGATQGVVGNANKHLSLSRSHFPERDQPSIQALIEVNSVILEEIDALLELLKAKNSGASSATENAKFQEKRAEAIEMFVELGFDERLFE